MNAGKHRPGKPLLGFGLTPLGNVGGNTGQGRRGLSGFVDMASLNFQPAPIPVLVLDAQFLPGNILSTMQQAIKQRAVVGMQHVQPS